MSQTIEELARMLVGVLTQRKLTLAVAESCTGGRIAAAITAIPGASECFLGGILAYANSAKHSILEVKLETLNEHGAVSAECAREMALGAGSAFGADFAIATTGIAGPGGATEDKPVGLVYIACAAPGLVDVEECRFSGRRLEIQEAAVQRALERLSQLIC